MQKAEPAENKRVCQYCDNDNDLDLTQCDNCQVIFCIYCVGYDTVGTETYDICPGCQSTFEW